VPTPEGRQLAVCAECRRRGTPAMLAAIVLLLLPGEGSVTQVLKKLA
jgi:hypothetical protein